MNSLIFDGSITRLQRADGTFHTRLIPVLTPRPASEDVSQQGVPIRIRYLPARPADKSVLELDDADYTWQLNAEQCAELETFIADFDPAEAIAWPPLLPAEEQERLTRAERDRRLLATDYLLMPDYPISHEDLDAVKTYRQQLRDLSQAPNWPDIAWPTLTLGVEEEAATTTLPESE
ncbi:phage tail assembly chaperone [Aquitalea aquatica]|uniref:Phage tail assembly chaperone n=1 Tax=Aquitalea aquatica TaxID=3044273 RepID=A0A838YAR5_9NEIS|nr:phage tail assembly chaperone [Aquitalea magnusonii]MBA4709587.1 phage tail assembly chaperone [Aquitalea magnusonii]